MNYQNTLEADTQTDDLVLRFVGGKNDGQSVSISTECCMLGITRSSVNQAATKDRCAIYRGPDGVAMQSHGSEVLINGEAKSVHWLQVNDRIQLSDSQAVEVVQLGSVKSEREEPEVASEDSVNLMSMPSDQVSLVADELAAEADAEISEYEQEAEAVTETVDVEGERIDFVADVTSTEQNAENNLFDMPAEASDSFNQHDASVEQADSTPTEEPEQMNEVVAERFESLETSVNQLHDHTANVDRRFDRLENSLNALTEHLERLAASSLSPASVASEITEPEAFNTPVVQDVAAEQVAEELGTEASVECAVSPESLVEAPVVEESVEPIEDSAEVAPESDAVTEAAAPSEDYESSIASLFSDLAKEEPTESSDVAAVEGSVDLLKETTASEINAAVADADVAEISEPVVADDVDSVLASLQSTIDKHTPESTLEDVDPVAVPEASENVTALSLRDAAPTIELSDLIENAAAEVEPTEEAAAGFAERMMESMHGDSPTLSGAELVSQIGSGAALPVEATEAPAIPAEPVTPVAPDRVETRTESVAEIFARLQAGTPAPESNVEESAPATAARPPVQTTFEDIQASISAALDGDVTADSGIVNQQDASETVEPSEPAQPADDVNSVMERLRASVESEEMSNESVAEVAESEEAANKDDSVDDYMSMLLSRMKDESVAEASSVETPAAKSESEPLDEKNSGEPMADGEFMPRKKAAPIKSLDKMRELANSTSRSAVQRSVKAQQDERKKGLILQSLSLGSLALAGLMFSKQAYLFGSAFAVIFAVTFGYVLYEILRPVQGAEPIKPRVTTPAVNEADEPVAEVVPID